MNSKVTVINDDVIQVINGGAILAPPPEANGWFAGGNANQALQNIEAHYNTQLEHPVDFENIDDALIVQIP